mmetsp:Transcript_10463/g.23754  ORF Transcript_10463/g.23754 Transcript_10463/m.23754 type:complete len:316 (-) Transcript_10463:91-1038(-)
MQGCTLWHLMLLTEGLAHLEDVDAGALLAHDWQELNEGCIDGILCEAGVEEGREKLLNFLLACRQPSDLLQEALRPCRQGALLEAGAAGPEAQQHLIEVAGAEGGLQREESYARWQLRACGFKLCHSRLEVFHHAQAQVVAQHELSEGLSGLDALLCQHVSQSGHQLHIHLAAEGVDSPRESRKRTFAILLLNQLREECLNGLRALTSIEHGLETLCSLRTCGSRLGRDNGAGRARLVILADVKLAGFRHFCHAQQAKNLLMPEDHRVQAHSEQEKEEFDLKTRQDLNRTLHHRVCSSLRSDTFGLGVMSEKDKA